MKSAKSDQQSVLSPKTRAAEEEEEREATPLDRYHEMLVKRFGNLVRGWYEITNDQSTATYETFATGVRRTGWTGEPLQLSRMHAAMDAPFTAVQLYFLQHL